MDDTNWLKREKADNVFCSRRCKDKWYCLKRWTERPCNRKKIEKAEAIGLL